MEALLHAVRSYSSSIRRRAMHSHPVNPSPKPALAAILLENKQHFQFTKMKPLLLSLFCIVLPNATIIAAENPFVVGGVPATDREWRGTDYVDTFNAIQSAKVPLPIITDEYGKRVIDRLTTTGNFSMYQNKGLPISQRLGDYLQFQQGLNSIAKLYVKQASMNKQLHSETATLVAYSLRVAALGMDLVNEFVPTIPKDKNYEFRMRALKEFYGGLTTSFSATESSLGEAGFYSPADLTLILEAMHSTLPKLRQAFSEEFQQEIRLKLTKRLNDFTTQDRKLLESMIAELPAEQKAPGNGETAKKESQATNARDTAIIYFKALTEADVERANAVSSVPFSLRGKEILRSKEEIEAKHKEIATLKGKRKLPDYSVSVPKDVIELDHAIFPAYEVFRINITNTEYRLDIYVAQGDSPKVIGFADSNSR